MIPRKPYTKSADWWQLLNDLLVTPDLVCLDTVNGDTMLQIASFKLEIE
jgi:hypothetical protein